MELFTSDYYKRIFFLRSQKADTELEFFLAEFKAMTFSATFSDVILITEK